MKLTARLNSGRRGWNDDEPAVARIACELMLPRYFGAGYDVRAVSAFAREIVEKTGDGLGLGRFAVEALLRSCLGETEVDITGIRADAMMTVHVLAAGLATIRLGYDASDVRQLAADAESAAIGQGCRLQDERGS